ncbi:hypothetical protein PMAYCL1PPCAC_04246, partial [Pristionchus mayeri]
AKIECPKLPCPIPKDGAKGVQAMLTCPGEKWMLDDEYVTGQPVCKQDSSKNAAEFFINRTYGEEKLRRKAQCFTE